MNPSKHLFKKMKNFENKCSVSAYVGTVEQNAEQYQQCFIPKHPVSNGLVRFKVSDKWLGVRGDHVLNKKHGRVLPLIDHHGNITSFRLGIWKCTDYQLFATLLTTVYKRLRSRYTKYRFLKKDRLTDRMIFDLAFLQLMSSDYFNRRLKEVLKRDRNQVRKMCYWYINNKMDTPSRFLYGQACQSALWLQHRGRPCDKSIAVNVCRGTKRPLAERILSPTEYLQLSLTNWSRKFQLQYVMTKWERDALLGSKHISLFVGKPSNGQT